MTYFEDLGPCPYVGDNAAVVAVGWLDATHPFQTGPIEWKFFDALAALLVQPWQPFVSAGRHACELCRFTGGPSFVPVGNKEIDVGCNNLFVPTMDIVFAAPSLILHYIDAHQYKPPAAFESAVLSCPKMGSASYDELIHRHNLRNMRPGRLS